jgi:hypothetical protein
MEATPTQIINYFSGFKQNLVPLFQRPYTWGEKQWRTLWEDITSFYGLSDAKSTHFMGAVVTMPARSVPVGVSKFLMIDGQQRLTTIALLMCAIRDSLDESQQILRRRIQNFYLTNEGYEGTEFFKLLPTQGDRNSYAAVIENAGSSLSDSQFTKAYDYFRRRLRMPIDEGEVLDPKLILEIIETRLMVVMINLSDTDDPYLIFESLNFKGSPLEQADLVRNYFLMRFPLAEQQAVYDGLWLPMQNRLAANLTEFMRHFLGGEGEEVRKSDVYAAIKRLVADSDAASVRLLMTRMERLSVLYSRLAASGSEPVAELSRYFDHFRRLDFGSVYPLLLALYEDYIEQQFGVDEFISTLRILHSFILRRMVVGVPSNSLSGLFISLCRTKPVADAPSAWLAAALGKEAKNRRWPSDNEFEERWRRAPIYGSRACQIILECIEEQNGHHEPPQFSDATIEHVMPQTLTPEWEEMLGPEQVIDYAEWLHTMGNLTLTGYNPELGNRPYLEKRTMFSLSHFELNRYFGTRETWGLAEIRDRAMALFRTAIQIWPRPPITPADAGISDKTLPAAFHAECIQLVQKQLGISLSKLSQTRYESSDGQTRLICAVSADHNESSGIPYCWFAVHRNQLDFLETVPHPWICLGCGSAETTLLIPLSAIQESFELMSVTKSEDRHYWHVVVQKKAGKLVLRLLGGKDGPDLTRFDIGKGPKTATAN